MRPWQYHGAVVPVSRHPLDRSAAFTALLEFCPWFGRTESRKAEAVVTRFLADFYASGETDMAAYARRWELIMTSAERAIRWSTVAAVAVVAAVAGWVSYSHALAVVRAHGETGPVAWAYR